MVDLADINKECLESLFDCVDNVIKYLDPDEKAEQLNKLQTLLKEYCILDYQQQVSNLALEKAANGLNASNLSTLEASFAKNLKSLITNTQPKPVQHPAYKKFEAKVSHVPEDSDDLDVVQTAGTEQYIDPITQRQIVSPLRNKKCNHVYEKTILDIIKMRPRTKCPIVGCTNRDPISRSDLFEDENLKLLLSQMQEPERDPLEDSD